MIQRMSKYSFLVYHREYDDFLATLRGLGVVHITERTKPQEVEELKGLLETRRELASRLSLLRPLLSEEAEKPRRVELAQGEALVAELDSLTERKHRLEQELQSKRTEVKEQGVWGEFDPNLLERLEGDGHRLSFYAMSSSAFTPAFAEEYEALSVVRDGATQYFVRLEPADSKPGIPEAELVQTPRKSLSTLVAEEVTLVAELEAAETELAKWAHLHIAELEGYDLQLASKYTYGATRLQATPAAEDKLRILEGWVPEADAKAMEAGLDAEGYYHKQLEITDEDRVPIKLRNNAFARMFESITGMFSLPNYGEIDQTALLAPFFLLFFGLCFGDGGYGLLLFVVATFFKFRRKGQDNTLLSLLQWLGGGAFVIGMLMGSFFGVTLGYAKAEDYFMRQDNMMMISVVIGLIQIFFAKGVAAYKTKVQRGWAHALAPTAWLVVLLGGALVFALPKLNFVVPEVVKYVLYGIVGLSLLVVFFYNTPGKNPLVNFGAGLWTTYNVASGLLGDTLSYIRLFAIGLTGGILGSVFNQLAIEQTAGLPIFLQIPLMVIILVLGHGLNIGLAMISSFVHPLRLTFVEYYKNSEFEGGGKAYTPFKED